MKNRIIRQRDAILDIDRLTSGQGLRDHAFYRINYPPGGSFNLDNV